MKYTAQDWFGGLLALALMPVLLVVYWVVRLMYQERA